MFNTPAGLPTAVAKSKLALEQATAALRAGDRSDAVRLLRKHLLEQPQDAAALAKLAELTLDQQQIEETTVLLRRAAGADPTPQRQMMLVRHLQQFVGAEAMLSEIEQLPPGMRGSFEVQTIEAAGRGLLGDHDRQIAIYRDLVCLNSGNAALWKTYGDALKTVGRTEEAVVALRKAIEANPNYGEAYWTLSNFKSFKFTDRDVSAMKKALRGALADIDALHFHFALGAAYEARSDYPKSFQHYREGNRTRAKGVDANALGVTDFVDRAVATFTPQLFERNKGVGCQAKDPIFVLGLHRSGSTLIEQILASHPLIEGTSELTIMQQIWGRLSRSAGLFGREAFEEIASLCGEELRKIGEEYLDRSRSFRATDRPYFVDKLPANWMNIGLIRLALPNAKIIDARRHPMACGFSNFKQNYASGVLFSLSQTSIGNFYRDYVRFMEHIDRVQPGGVHRVLNERLIDDPEGETRKLLEFIDVPFDPACLEFHRNKRAVQTPSAEQVRRPINRDGVDHWRHYARWLDPMKEALGPALNSWDKPQSW